MMNNPTLTIDKHKVFAGHNLDILRTFDDNSIDSIVTDPPYELGFMGKSWDNSGIAYSVELWRECLRVLKPGGHLLAFGGSRTWHRLAVAIEDAGFEMRDSIAWLYGSGFPKSHNISKAIDKLHGAERERIPTNEGIASGASNYGGGSSTQLRSGTKQVDSAITDDAKKWDGWGTALKPAFEPIVVARKPLIGTVAENVLQFGTGGINIDASRIGFDVDDKPSAGNRTATFGTQETISGGDGSGGYEANPVGRWPANVMFSHTEDCVQIGTSKEKYSINKLESWSGFGQVERPDYESGEQVVSNPVFECVDGCPVKLLDEQSGIVKGKVGVKHLSSFTFTAGGEYKDNKFASQKGLGDSGGASRFFYVAKASKRDRNEGLDELPTRPAGSLNMRTDSHSIANEMNTAPRQNFHPTVKPTQLMKYLIKLVTPEAGVVLNPFAGSGSTGKAAILEGFTFIGIELTADYLPIITSRLQHAYETYRNKADDLFE